MQTAWKLVNIIRYSHLGIGIAILLTEQYDLFFANSPISKRGQNKAVQPSDAKQVEPEQMPERQKCTIFWFELLHYFGCFVYFIV